ncbi:hypothetical protein KQI52_02810 [bacterium]|nr:hypothetical protein [bacterium]
MDYLLVALLVPITSIIATAVVLVFLLERFYRVRKLDHEAKLAAIEKGYDVPMKKPRPQYPFAWPLVLLGFGLALILIFAISGGYDNEALGFGLVLFMIGAGLFASRFIGVRRQSEEDTVRQSTMWKSPDPAPATPADNGESSQGSL